ncbi:MAG: DnaA regulatory inactivator Hda [Rhodoferax sp.]|nr:DnaA regulatory inactivator Hda [Rhodoferax sp.]
MKQIALDIGLSTGPSLANFYAGPNVAAHHHMASWIQHADSHAGKPPVPTYLWGAQGSGKTHLLKAAREGLREHGARVGWLSPREMPGDFDDGWAAVVLDDVHLYSAEQQHLAFNWFVNAQTHCKPVLAAGQAAPAHLDLREDLRTRLGWGHVFQLHRLNEQEGRSVLRQEADARGVFLSDEVMDFMWHRFSRDLGSLMELLDHMDGYALQTRRAITIPLIKSMLENT